MVEVTESDVQKANEAFDIAFSADPEGIDKVMTALFATHRIEAAKAERGRLRNLPDELVARVIAGVDKRRSRRRVLPRVATNEEAIRMTASALADALESQP